MSRPCRTGICRRALPRLYRLEDRTVPAPLNALLSRSDPTLIGDTAGGDSYVENDMANGPYTNRLGENVSADGRYVAFLSKATNLVPGQMDANDAFDLFLHDRLANTTALVSHAHTSPTVAGNGQGWKWYSYQSNASHPALSADGRYVTYTSDATDLVSGFTGAGGAPQNVYLYDRLTGVNTLVSRQHNSATTGGSATSDFVYIAAGGGVVTFGSSAVNLVAGFPNPGGGTTSKYTHAYAYDVATGHITLLDHKHGSSEPAGGTGRVRAVTPDGRYVVVTSSASDMLSTPTANSVGNVYRHDRLTGLNELVSRSAAAPLGGNAHSSGFAISADGAWVGLSSAATNLLPGATTPGINQLFLADVAAGSVRLVSHDAADPLVGGNDASGSQAMSADGRYIAFRSRASNLVTGFVDGNSATSFDAYLYDRVTDQVKLLNHTPGSAITSGNGATTGTRLSSDGQTVVFGDLGTDLVAGFVDRNGSLYIDLYRYDLATGEVTLLSGRHGSATEGGDHGSNYAALSADGKVLAISTEATDLASSIIDTNAYSDVYVKELTTGAISLVSRRFGMPSLSAGGEADSVGQTPDGQFVVFTNTAANLVPGQVEAVNGTLDVFLLDRATNTTVLVSHTAGAPATAGNRDSGLPVISADGRYVAYVSYAGDLVAGFADGNGLFGTDVFLFDRLTGMTELVSRQAGTVEAGGNGGSGYSNGTTGLGISGDGRWVSFGSQAGDLMVGFIDNNGTNTGSGTGGADVFLFDRLAGANTLVNHLPGQPEATSKNGASYYSTLSADGRYVAYNSNSADVVPGMTGSGPQNLVLYDRVSDTHVLVSHAAGSATVGGDVGTSSFGAFSSDGKFIVYGSYSSNLIAGGTDTNGGNDIFLYDLLSGTNTLISHAAGSAAVAASDDSFMGYQQDFSGGRIISADGRYVVYESEAQDLVPGFVDGDNKQSFSNTDVYLFDRVTGANTLVSLSVASPVVSGNQGSSAPTVSGDGRLVAFTSYANDLVGGFSIPTPTTGQAHNAYVYDRLTGIIALVTRDATQPVGGLGGIPAVVTINGDGSVIAYISGQTNLVPGDLNGFADVFAYVTPPPRVQSVQVADGSTQRSVIRSLTVSFDQPVLFAGSPKAAFRLLRNGGVVSGGWSAVSQNSPGTFTITFTGPVAEFGSLVDGSYRLEVLASQVSNIGALDGNGDGIGGDDYAYSFHRLFGDADGDRTVGPLDFAALRSAFGSPSIAFDFDGDGDTDAADFFQFRRRFGVTLP